MVVCDIKVNGNIVVGSTKTEEYSKLNIKRKINLKKFVSYKLILRLVTYIYSLEELKKFLFPL